ncbi:MAG: phosphatidate cytidylyltransferase [Myxococcota bacterium]
MDDQALPGGQPEPTGHPEEAPGAAGQAAPEAAEAEATPQTGRISRSLQLRLLSAGLIIPTVLALIVLGGIPFLLVVVAIICLALREFYDIIEVKGLHPQKMAGIGGAALLGVVSWVGNEYQTNVLLTAVLLVVMILQLLKRDVAEAISSISATFFGVFYVGWLMSHAILLRRMDEILRIKYGAPAEGPFWVGGMFIDQNLGIFLLMFCIAIIAATDACAYFVGRRLGRRKLAPRISPNKTVEGAIGGVIGGVLVGTVFWAIFNYWLLTSPALPFRQMLVIATLLAVFGILGDLAESLIKRDAKTKDTGTLFPGMGGMLDRIDSHMVAFPVLYYYMSAWFFFRNIVGG